MSDQDTPKKLPGPNEPSLELAPYQRVVSSMLMNVTAPNAADVVASLMSKDAAVEFAYSMVNNLMKVIDKMVDKTSELEEHLENSSSVIMDNDAEIIRLKLEIDQLRADVQTAKGDRNEEFVLLEKHKWDLENALRAETSTATNLREEVSRLSGVLSSILHHPEMTQIILGDQFEPFLNELKLNHKIECIKILRRVTGMGLVESKELVEALSSEGIYNTFKIRRKRARKTKNMEKPNGAQLAE